MASNNGPVITHFRITHSNNTDGRNSQLSRLETREQEDKSLSAVAHQSGNLRRKLITIRNLAEAQRPDLYANQLHELAKEAIEIHSSLIECHKEVSNHILRKRKDLAVAQKRMHAQELLTDWNEHEVYRLRCQVDTILGMQRRPKLYYDVAMNAYQEELDYSDAASSTSARSSDNREEGGNSSGEPPHCEVVGRSE